MKTLNNEIIIHRNETFTLDKILENKDGSPYIISNKLSNACFLITISSTRYQQEGRYIKNYWLTLNNYPRFTYTNAVDLHSIKTSATGTTNKYSNFDSVTGPDYITIEGESKRYLVYGYVNGKLTYFDVDDCVFYLDDTNGRTYKYWSLPEGEDTGGEWKTYTCRIVKAFLQSDTVDLVEQSYVYSIRLVSGQSVLEYLRVLCDKYDIEYSTNDSAETLYNLLIAENVEFDENFDINRYIVQYDTVTVILAPSKLAVLSDISGGLL